MDQSVPDNTEYQEVDSIDELKEVRQEEKAEAKPLEEKPLSQEEIANLHKARDAERHKRQAIQKEKADLERRLQETENWKRSAEERLQQFMASQQKPLPSYDDDPLTNLKGTVEQQQAALRQLAEQRQQEEWQRQQATQVQGLVAWGQSQAQEFRTEKPDFDDAYKFVGQRRAAELKATGLPDHEIAATIARDEVWIMNLAYQQGRNPAQVIYEMAQNTGYTKPGQQKIETMQKGTQASKTLGSGGQANGKITLDQLAAMSQDEFDAYCNQNGGMKKVMAQASR